MVYSLGQIINSLLISSITTPTWIILLLSLAILILLILFIRSKYISSKIHPPNNQQTIQEIQLIKNNVLNSLNEQKAATDKEIIDSSSITHNIVELKILVDKLVAHEEVLKKEVLKFKTQSRDTKEKNEILQAQEEEMRQNMEELMASQETLEKQKEELQQKEEKALAQAEKMKASEKVLRKIVEQLKNKEAETREKNELLQAQEEELRQNLEEMQVTQEQLQKQKDELELREKEALVQAEKMKSSDEILRKVLERVKQKEKEGREKNEQLQAQEEELRQNMEELQTTQDVLKTQKDELEQKEEQERIRNKKLKANEQILKKAFEKIKSQETTIRQNFEELQSQEEELQQNIEELKSTQEVLKKRNETIDRKNRYITSSIKYAKNIQQAILPGEVIFSYLFKDYFALFQPKDIVSGDFYWCEKLGDTTLIAVVDCTGHGVPGAFMSVIGNSILEEIVLNQRVTNPALILELLHHKIRKNLRQETTENRDGMDLGLCSIIELENKSYEVTFAGAKRPLYYFKEKEFKELSGDRKSIGGWQPEEEHTFTNQKIILHQGDSLYLSSDGYGDNPNPKRKRFGDKKLKQILISNQEKTLKEQKQILLDNLKHHQGIAEQRDDITILGVKF